MHTELTLRRSLINAALALGLLGLAALGVAKVAGRHWQWQDTVRVRAEFATVAGLEAGAKVRVQGMDAGVVEAIVPPGTPGEPVALRMRIDRRLKGLVRADAEASIVTQGVVGSKVVEITPGSPGAAELGEGGTLRSVPPTDLADVVREARASLKTLDEVATAAREGLGEINAIAATIRRGEGSLGKLVNDDDAYRRLLALSDRGERTLNDLDENLLALKTTWPLSRYFDRRGFSDRDLVLFQPGSERDSRVLAEPELFEPGRAVLTAEGRKRLDEVAAWCKGAFRPKTEVVVAGFHDDPRGEDFAEALSREQAEAVRSYLVSHHALDTKGWFGLRKVAAVGFGTALPRTMDPPPADLPSRRVEVILFTPQG